MKLPDQLCAGVAGGGGEVEIQILGGGVVVGSLGRYPLRC